MEAVDDFWMLDSDVPPDPGATTSSIDFNMAHARLQLLRVILIVYDYLSNVDSFNYRSLVNTLMAVENLRKDSLFLYCKCTR